MPTAECGLHIAVKYRITDNLMRKMIALDRCLVRVERLATPMCFTSAIFILSGMDRYIDRSAIPHTVFRMPGKRGLRGRTGHETDICHISKTTHPILTKFAVHPLCMKRRSDVK